MKKSEAIEKLRVYIEEQNSGMVCAEQILAFVEGLGMLPPNVSEEDCQAIMSVYYAGYSFNQWDEALAKDEKLQEAKRKRALAKIARDAKREARVNK